MNQREREDTMSETRKDTMSEIEAGTPVLVATADRPLYASPPSERAGERDALRDLTEEVRERTDALAEAVWRAAAEPKCGRCGHPASWHRLDDSTDEDPTDPDAQFRCIGYDCMAPGRPKDPCGCPDFLATSPAPSGGETR